MEDQVQMLEEQLARKSEELALKLDETFETAVGILDNSATRMIGDEIDSATLVATTILNDPQERTRMIERLQKRAMTELRPEPQVLKQELIKEVELNLGKVLEEARGDLHINQAKLTGDADKKRQLHYKLAKQAIEELKKGLQTQAETLESALEEKHHSHSNNRQARTPQPASRWNPQPPNTGPKREPSRNPYKRTPVSPHAQVDTPAEEQWHRSVSQHKEKVLLTHPLPQDAQGLNETQAEGFSRQL
jgi:hypothetical protein